MPAEAIFWIGVGTLVWGVVTGVLLFAYHTDNSRFTAEVHHDG